MDLERYLATTKDLIDGALDAYLPASGVQPRTLHKALRYSVFPGGKRIRSVIVIASAQACGISRKEKALPAACAVELVHTYSLIHDDLPSMDDDDYRRGKPACHKAFGEAIAILAGDSPLTLAFDIIAGRLPPEVSVRIARELSDAIGTSGMVGGQAADIESSGMKRRPAMIRRINRLKTARLFEASANLGALSARAGPGERRAMSAYGANLGAAFQMIDDIDDMDGTARALGAKRAMSGARYAIKKAKLALRPFGAGGDILRAIADKMLERIS